MPNYHDESAPLVYIDHTYLDMNYAHCHNPDAWREAAERDVDFRYEAPIRSAKVLEKTPEI